MIEYVLARLNDAYYRDTQNSILRMEWKYFPVMQCINYLNMSAGHVYISFLYRTIIKKRVKLKRKVLMFLTCKWIELNCLKGLWEEFDATFLHAIH